MGTYSFENFELYKFNSIELTKLFVVNSVLILDLNYEQPLLEHFLKSVEKYLQHSMRDAVLFKIALGLYPMYHAVGARPSYRVFQSYVSKATRNISAARLALGFVFPLKRFPPLIFVPGAKASQEEK